MPTVICFLIVTITNIQCLVSKWADLITMQVFAYMSLHILSTHHIHLTYKFNVATLYWIWGNLGCKYITYNYPQLRDTLRLTSSWVNYPLLVYTPNLMKNSLLKLVICWLNLPTISILPLLFFGNINILTFSNPSLTFYLHGLLFVKLPTLSIYLKYWSRDITQTSVNHMY